jgi:hypothetical protein
MKIFINNNYNLTTRFLSCTVIKPDGLDILIKHGLKNVYIDNYTHKKKYEGCLHFLMDPTTTLEAKSYQDLEKDLTSFESFYDYYDLNENGRDIRVYVFRIHSIYKDDVESFRLGNYYDLSTLYWKTIGVNKQAGINVLNKLKTFNENIEEEVYNYFYKLKKESY